MSVTFAKSTVFILISTIALISSAESVSSASTGELDQLNQCVSKTELDCVESITVYQSNELKFQYAQNSNKAFESIDGDGNKIISNDHIWSAVFPSAEVQKLGFTINLSNENFYSSQYKHAVPQLWVGLDQPYVDQISPDFRIKFAIRTSWLKPVNVAMYGNKALFQDESIQGGHRYTFVLSKFKATNWGTEASTGLLDQQRSTRESWVLYFLIDHASEKEGVSFYSTRCSKYGYTVESSNAIGAGQPFMNSPDSLNFAIGAPHLLSDGSQNIGFFTSQIQKTYMDCMWPNNTITKSTGADVSIIDSSGAPEISTSTANYLNGTLYVTATGFHYSNPTVVIKGSATTNVPFTLPSILTATEKEVSQSTESKSLPSKQNTLQSQIKVILCKKGPLQIKVSAFNPKCPKNYVKF